MPNSSAPSKFSPKRHNRGAVKRLIGFASGLCLAGMLLGACYPPGPTVTYTQYQLTCCTQADIDRVWQPGTTVELHWIVRSATTTTANPTHAQTCR
jgi:hypothetical protein